MNLNSLITGPARLALKLGGQAFDALQSRIRGGAVDDTTLQREVEAEVQASRRAPKGKVEVNVTDAVVWLRGEVKTKDAIDELEERAASVDGVERVENLLRVAKAPKRARTQKRPAPKRSTQPRPAAATAPPPQAEPAAAPAAPEPSPAPAAPRPSAEPTLDPAAQEERPVTRRFSSEQTSGSDAEPTPRELAESGEGRRPAPLGATVGSPPAPFPTAPEGAGSPGPDPASPERGENGLT